MATISVRRGNIVLDVASELKDQYMKAGYSVIDDSGAVVEAAMSTDLHELQIMVGTLQEENKKLKAEIAKLKKTAKQ